VSWPNRTNKTAVKKIPEKAHAKRVSLMPIIFDQP
jgi:hypothetical protein